MNNTLVLKVGTSTLVRPSRDGADQLDVLSFERIGHQVDEVLENGWDVVLVSSGARQRLPAVGWESVFNAWSGVIAAKTHDFLLTDNELNSLSGHPMLSCARMGRVAIVNDAPTLSEGSPYRNNDILSATIARHIGETLRGESEVQLGILSDVSGVLADTRNPDSVIPVIDDLDAYEHLAGGTNTAGATGGMKTKFMAARIALRGGAQAWVAHGRTDGIVHQALSGSAGTRFTSNVSL